MKISVTNWQASKVEEYTHIRTVSVCGHYLAILRQFPDSINLQLLTDFSNQFYAKPDFMFPELNASFLCYIKGELQIRRGNSYFYSCSAHAFNRVLTKMENENFIPNPSIIQNNRK